MLGRHALARWRHGRCCLGVCIVHGSSRLPLPGGFLDPGGRRVHNGQLLRGRHGRACRLRRRTLVRPGRDELLGEHLRRRLRDWQLQRRRRLLDCGRRRNLGREVLHSLPRGLLERRRPVDLHVRCGLRGLGRLRLLAGLHAVHGKSVLSLQRRGVRKLYHGLYAHVGLLCVRMQCRLLHHGQRRLADLHAVHVLDGHRPGELLPGLLGLRGHGMPVRRSAHIRLHFLRGGVPGRNLLLGSDDRGHHVHALQSGHLPGDRNDGHQPGRDALQHGLHVHVLDVPHHACEQGRRHRLLGHNEHCLRMRPGLLKQRRQLVHRMCGEEVLHGRYCSTAGLPNFFLNGLRQLVNNLVSAIEMRVLGGLLLEPQQCLRGMSAGRVLPWDVSIPCNSVRRRQVLAGHSNSHLHFRLRGLHRRDIRPCRLFILHVLWHLRQWQQRLTDTGYSVHLDC